MAMTVIGACISQGVWKKDGRDIVYNNLKICYVEELSIIKDDSGNVTAFVRASITVFVTPSI